MKPSNGKRGSINLTALGSAAVIAIYSAGYMRTRTAAKRYEGSDSDRRPVPAATPLGVDSSITLAPVDSTPVVSAPTIVKVAAKATIKIDSVPPKEIPEPDKPASVDTVPVAVAPPVDSTRAAADSVRARKDGTYTGWGTSRHGDIEAAVEIKAGRIVNAYITQCLTRYSCGRIALIIPQVVARQSAEVDFVSGATQSSDAFYYAIVEALSKAK